MPSPRHRPRGAVRYTSSQRPDIEGLRAFAVASVVAYHAAVPFLPGGFIGVDVFFVISGYLITRLLLAEASTSSTISLRHFYARRARRIIPSAAVTLAVSGVAAYYLLDPLRVASTSKDLVSSALFVSNWRFIEQGTNYLNETQAPSPYLHYWSLAVEEQFYLIWPILLLAVLALVRLRPRTSLFALLSCVIGTVTALSFALSLWWSQVSAPTAYMSSPSRAWQFGAGALLAVCAPLIHRRDRTIRTRTLGGLIGWCGLVALSAACLLITSKTVYPGWAALIPTVSTVAIIFAGELGDVRAGGVARLLGLAPLRWLGRLSFAWYLWHWPVLTLFQARYPNASWSVLACVALASVLPAMLTVRFVEKPIRYSGTISARASSGLAVGVIAGVVAIVAGLVTGTEAISATAGSAPQDARTAVLRLPTSGDPFVSSLTGGPVVPAVINANKDWPPYPAQCILSPSQTLSPACIVNTDGTLQDGPATSRRVVLVGDSHAGEWFGAIRAYAASSHLSIEVLNKEGCPLATISVINPQLGRTYTECDTWRESVYKRLATEARPKAIFVASLNYYSSDQGAVLRGWERSLVKLSSSGAPLVYLRDTPFPRSDVPACVSGALDEWSKCAFSKATAFHPDPLMAGTPKSHGLAARVDVDDYLCPASAGRCPAVRAGVLLYRDGSHATETAMTALGPSVSKQLNDAGL